MTVGELMMRLEDYPEDAEVMIMHQPDWPLREVIRGLVSAGEIARERRSDEDAEFDAMLDDLDPDERGEAWQEREAEMAEAEASAEKIVYLVADGHPYEGSPYGDKVAWDLT